MGADKFLGYKMVCVFKDHSYLSSSLTINKVYHVTGYTVLDYQLIDDCNNEVWFPRSWFKHLQDIRDLKINTLLNV